MKYPISNLYIKINDNSYKIGVVLGEEDKPNSPFTTEYVTMSEYEDGFKKFIYGSQYTDDCVYHMLGPYYTDGEPKEIEKKWIDELALMGFDVSRIKYKLKDTDQ